MKFEAYEEEKLECYTCNRKIVCKYFEQMVKAFNVRGNVMRGKCIHWIKLED